MPKISIIIPIYNVERYLRRCLDSVVSQTFADFECILIDDASPDGCPAICDEYAEQDSRIKVVHKKQNEGLQKARKKGIDIAVSGFVTHVDSDDWLEKNALELLYNKQQETGASLVIGEIKRICQDGEETVYEFPEITKETNILAYFFLNRCRNLVAKLYKKSLFSDYIIPESSIGEDAVTNVQIFSRLQADEVQVVNTVIYYYEARTNGMVSYVNAKRVFYASFENNPHIACRLWIERYLNKRDQNDAVRSAFAYYMIREGFVPHLKESKNIPRKEERIFYSHYYKPCTYKHLLYLGDKVIIEVFHVSIFLGKLYVVLRAIWGYIKFSFIEKSKKTCCKGEMIYEHCVGNRRRHRKTDAAGDSKTVYQRL
jgi:glycosyltransferase involved in cell wall biosynthesis